MEGDDLEQSDHLNEDVEMKDAAKGGGDEAGLLSEAEGDESADEGAPPGVPNMELDTGGSQRGLKDISDEVQRMVWTIVKAFFKEKTLVAHQVSAFNDFMNFGLQRLIDEAPVHEIPPDHNPSAVRHDDLPKQARVRFGKVHVVKPNTSMKPPKPVVNFGVQDADKKAADGDKETWGSGENGAGENGEGGGQGAAWGNGDAAVDNGWNKPAPEENGWGGAGGDTAMQDGWASPVKGQSKSPGAIWGVPGDNETKAGATWGLPGDNETNAGVSQKGGWEETKWGDDSEKVSDKGKGKGAFDFEGDEVNYGLKAGKGKAFEDEGVDCGKTWGGDEGIEYGSKASKGGKLPAEEDEVAFGNKASKGKVQAGKEDVWKQAWKGDSDGDDEEDPKDRGKGIGKAKGNGKLDAEEETAKSKGRTKATAADRKKKGKAVEGDQADGGVEEATERRGSGGKKRKSRKETDAEPEEEDVRTVLYPREARLRNLTYAADVYVDMTVEVYVAPSGGTTSKAGKSGSRAKSSSSKDSSAARPAEGEERILEKKTLPREHLGKIPVMVKSEFCNLHGLDSKLLAKEDDAYDIGGYFIIKGAEKVFFAQEQPFIRRLTLSRNKDGLTASSGGVCKGTNMVFRNTVYLRRKVLKKGSVEASGPLVCQVRLRRVNDTIPLVIVLRALGVVTDREVLKIVCVDLEDSSMVEVALPFIQDADKEMTDFLEAEGKNPSKARERKNALKYIYSKLKTKSKDYLEGVTEVLGLLFQEQVINSEVVQEERSVPEPEALDDNAKALLLGYMAHKLCCCYLGRLDLDDRDNFRNKRLDSAGHLLSLEFRNLMVRFKNEMRRRIQKALAKVSVNFRLDTTIFTLGFQRAFSTGNWSAPGDMNSKCTGVISDLPRANPMSAYCQLRKTRTQVNYIAKATNARYLNYSHWGRVCSLETPDGENCGLVKSLALTSFVSVESSEKIVHDFLAEVGMTKANSIKTDYELMLMSDKVFLNGKWVGCHADPDSLVRDMRNLRRQQCLNNEVEIVQDKKMREVRVYTDAGRPLRPLLIVEDQRLRLNAKDIEHLESDPARGLTYLLERGVLEFLGVEEEEEANIAADTAQLESAQGSPDALAYTHCEIHAHLTYGLGASGIPFANYNQSSRDMQQAQKHGKQAIGNYATNLRARSDTTAHELFYPQTQLVKTGAINCLQMPELANGQTAIVAIACYSGYNQEDSLVMNQSSIDRGLFRSFHYKTHRSILRRGTGEQFGKPDPENSSATKNAQAYEKLDTDGFPYVGANLAVGDIVVGKVRVDTSNIGMLTDASEKAKVSNRGRVDQVILTTEEDGTYIAKVRVRLPRAPQIGDKFSSMHGQKGVIGMILPQEDMPFTREGIVPDIIVNPHAFPTRQTLGQLMENLLGKVVACPVKEGKRKLMRSDATPFTSLTTDAITEELHQSGYGRWAKECMYNGLTGEKMTALINIGPTFYQRLTHMVSDKVKYRGRGFVHPLTRQPVKERDRHGGVKFGEMERDCMIAHGAAMTLRERTFVLSDFYRIYYCKDCEVLASMDNVTRIPSCRICRQVKHVVQLEIPYACKLLHQELLSMGICVRLITEPC